MDELIDDRKVYENLIREICEDLKVFKPSRAEKGYKNKLV